MHPGQASQLRRESAVNAALRCIIVHHMVTSSAATAKETAMLNFKLFMPVVKKRLMNAMMSDTGAWHGSFQVVPCSQSHKC